MAREDTNGDTAFLPEIAEILTAGLMRALVRKSSHNSTNLRESSLDISRGESGHEIPAKERMTDG